MNTQKYYDDRAKEIRERWFPKHVAQFGDMTNDGMCKMFWSQPGTSNYSVVYIISKRHLIVYGDIGEAVYEWAQDLTWDWLAGLNLSYFAGKCEASEEGLTFAEWDSDVAKDKLADYLRENSDAREAFEDADGTLDKVENKFEWRAFLDENGYEVFGDCWYEFAPDFGTVHAMRCQAHLIGLQMAWAQYQETQKTLPTLEEVQQIYKESK